MKPVHMSRSPWASIALATALPLVTAVFATQAYAQTGNQPLGCIIEPQKQADVGSPLVGVVDAVMVDRGAPVRKGQVIATMRNEVERANVESARSRASADAEIHAANANRDVAKIKMKRIYELLRLGFASQLEYDQAKGEFEIADQRLAQAREGKQVAARELQGAEAQLRQRTVRAPFDGVIVDRFIQPGERIDGKPIFRVAALNPLRVEVIVPSTLYGQIREGMTLPVQPEFAGAAAVSARVVQVDRLVDAASGTFRARLDMPNPKQDVPAGVRCKLTMNTPQAPAGAAGTQSAVPPQAPTAAASLRAEAPKFDGMKPTLKP